MAIPPSTPPPNSQFQPQFAAAAPVNNNSTWQDVVEGLTENDATNNAPARRILHIVQNEESTEEISYFIEKMQLKNNYGGISELLDELEKNPEGPIFEALKELCTEIVGQTPSGSDQDRDEIIQKNPIITNLLAKAIQTEKHGAIHAICSAIPCEFEEDDRTFYQSTPLMRSCLELVIYDENKTNDAKMILDLFCDTVTKAKGFAEGQIRGTPSLLWSDGSFVITDDKNDFDHKIESLLEESPRDPVKPADTEAAARSVDRRE